MERRQVRGIEVIRVRGTYVERGLQHARLLRDRIPSGALPHLARKTEKMIRRGPGLVQHPLVQEAAVWFYKHALLKRLERGTSAEKRGLLRALPAITGIPYADYLSSNYQAETLMMVCRVSIMKHLLGELPRGGLAGCTSAVVAKGRTRHGRLLVARNQDYPMVGPWESNTTVVFQDPTEPGHLPHVSVTTAGVHASGLTAMNREGLTVSAHAHFGRRIDLGGRTVVDIGDRLIARARSIGEAVDLARGMSPCAHWAFVVSSAREDHAAVLEMAPGKLRVHEMDGGLLAHSNFFHTPELQAEEAMVSGAFVEDLEGRLCGIRRALGPAFEAGAVDPAAMARALGDAVDPFTGEERVVGNTVSVVTTIKSVVFEPASQTLWVSARGETPTGLGDFVGLRGDGADATGEAATLEGYRPRTPGFAEGMGHYREAYRAYHMDEKGGDFAGRALVHLRAAVAAYPGDAHLWLQLGIVAFVHGDLPESLAALERAGALRMGGYGRGVCDLYRGRCLDLLGHRAEARRVYGDPARIEDPELRKAVARGGRRPYRASEKGTILVDLQFPGTIQY